MENKLPRAATPLRFPSIPQNLPPGLLSLYRTCHEIYTDQPNPLQVTAMTKYWLGGPDPLDYVSMYVNHGDPQENVPPHWHYISFGLSDLHGDGRVHEITGSDAPSGFGFELTFRLLRDPTVKANPPTWPAAIMQALAKYVFQSRNKLCAGDHVSWHCPLDNSDSGIQHMLMMEDPQLKSVETPCGLVNFIQIVGICDKELQAAQEWNGPGMIELMQSVNGLGGKWLVTDMKRDLTMFEMSPTVQVAVTEGIQRDGSNLSGVGARCSWEEVISTSSMTAEEEAQLGTDFARCVQVTSEANEQIKDALKNGLGNNTTLPQTVQAGASNVTETPVEQRSQVVNGISALSNPPQQIKFLSRVKLHFNLEAGAILPLALQGRLKHGRHFTFKSVVGDVAITILPVSVSGAFVNLNHPYAAHGPWLQVLLKDDDVNVMLRDLNELNHSEAMSFPKTFEWCNKTLTVTLLMDDVSDSAYLH